jgi:putative CocE/NonD family hydrolase
MSDSDSGSAAWVTRPSQYASRREAAFALPEKPVSVYVPMRDGCRLALDCYLPQSVPGGPDAGGPFPVIAIFTPYYRRFALADTSLGTEPTPNAAKYRDYFVPRGYALVVVDVRGTGASFGTRDSFRSPRERDDYREVADWIVAQPWSNGVIGATGISYLGAACDFLASTGHPAVKAIAPISAVWDTYSDHYYPGGLFLNQLSQTYDRLMVALDHDRRDMLAEFGYFKDPNYAGPQPVDEDTDGQMCRAAVHQHRGNFHMPDFITEFPCRDDSLPYDPGFTSACFSPYHYREGIRPDVAVLSVSGWMDGAGYANGSIARFLTLNGNPGHLLLGPWDHGARVNTSPWRESAAPQFNPLDAILRFFDHYLCGMDTGLQDEQPVHYFSVHEEAWHAAGQWPPLDDSTTLHLAAGQRLADRPDGDGADDIHVDFSFGTGGGTRYERIAGHDSRDYHTDWQQRHEALFSYTSEPLPADAELTGHATADLWVASSEPDAAILLYLSEVLESGEVHYVTEGLLRALHRRETQAPDAYRASWPFRSFSRADASPMPVDTPQNLRFALLPVSWLFRRGSRIRLSVAGADADHIAQVPHGRPPRLRLWRDAQRPSSLVLPLLFKP